MRLSHHKSCKTQEAEEPNATCLFAGRQIIDSDILQVSLKLQEEGISFLSAASLLELPKKKDAK